MNSSKENLKRILYKQKINDISFIDLLDKLSENTIELIITDIQTEESAVKDTLYIFCDGGTKNNGSKNAKGGYSVYFTDESYYKFNVTKIIKEPTNNICELRAIKNIFKTISENPELFKEKNIIICTDSQYSINCLTKWHSGWIKNGWKTAKGQEVKNKELVQQILEYSGNIKFTFKHIYSHQKEPSNKKSLDYFMWYHNKIVDENINKALILI
jgi:ribonuclease HI